MKLLALNIFLLAGVTLGLVSCKKIIEQVPENTIYREGFWQSELDANGGLAGAYASLRNVLNSSNRHYYYGDIPAGIFDSFKGDTFLPGVANGNFVNSYQDDLLDWRPFYKVSANANLVIEKVPTIPAEKFEEGEAGRNRIVGEALFIRALTYFYLVRVWGDCVYVTSVEKDAQTEPNLAKTDKNIVLDGCIKDLKQAVEMLEFGYDDAAKVAVRANRGSAYALLAHIYAWRHQYDQTILAANEVINNGEYELLPIEETIGLFKGKSSESIFEIEFDSQTSEGNANGVAEHLLVRPYLEATDAYFIKEEFLTDVFGSETATDKRYDLYFEKSSNQKFFCKKYREVLYKDLANLGDLRCDDNIVIFRLSDIILLRAEAYVATKQFDKGRDDVNEIRDRAGLGVTPATDDQLMRTVFLERSKELVCEGHRYWDMIRLGTGENGGGFLPSFLTLDLVNQGAANWAILRDIFKDNNKLVQNPYWISRY